MLGRRRARRPKSGDLVEVRSAVEILATLDGAGASGSMPFMPEMLRHVGKRYTVSRRVEKICDTITGSYGSRRMQRTVLLEDLRCDGSSHGGCQAGCRIYWREEWLKRPDGSAATPEPESDDLAQVAAVTTTSSVGGEGHVVYRCQATDALLASQPLRTRDVRQYVRELTSGNLGIGRFLSVMARFVGMEVRRRLGKLDPLPVMPAAHETSDQAPLQLRPGDMVEVRQLSEIATTLDGRGMNRGLWFDREMAPYCGGRFRVQDRVERIIDERTGEMIELSSDCHILQGVVCSGERSDGRWFCPRAIYPFWREAWLRRVEEPGSSVPESASVRTSINRSVK